MEAAMPKGIKQRFLPWIKRLGIWGFLFFLIKGLIWLLVTYWIVR